MPSINWILSALAVMIHSVLGQWWQGAPECAQSCLSSAWTTVTTTSWWPQQSEYCGDDDKGKSIGDCISDACSETATAYTSYSSLSSSLCSRYASCTSAGSTGVQTYTYSGGPVTWAAPGGWKSNKFFPGGNNGNYGNNNNNNNEGYGKGGVGPWGGPNGTEYSQYWSDWASAYSGSKTWSGGAVTVTGCPFEGSPWFVGPNCGWNGLGGFNGWVGWGKGWSWGPTQTQTVTVTTTDSEGHSTTQTGLGTVAVAMSGTLTTSSIIGAVQARETGSSGQHNAAAALRYGGGVAAEGAIVTQLLGLGLGTVLAMVCSL